MRITRQPNIAHCTSTVRPRMRATPSTANWNSRLPRYLLEIEANAHHPGE